MEGEDDDESRESSSEQISEIEARLYSIVHYNDLSKPLDESITAQYDIQVTDSQIIVSLKAGQSDDEADDGSVCNNTLPPDPAAEDGESEAKIQKLSDEKSVECDKSVADQQSINSSKVMNEGGVDTESINNVEDKDKSTADEPEPTKHDPSKDEANSAFDDDDCAAGKGQTVEARQEVDYCLIAGIIPGKKKRKKARNGKKGRGRLENDEMEVVVDLTSDQDDSDCLVINDETDLNNSEEHGDDSLVLNIAVDDEPVPTVSAKVGDTSKSAKKTDRKESKKKKKTKIKLKRKLYHCPKKWTASMVKFYCKTSKRLAKFDHLALIKGMKEGNIPRDKWAVSKLDQKPQQYKNKRCDRCRQFGHVARFCVEPVKPVLCYMCGNHGHRESRCPERKCLNCGTPNEVYIEMCSDCHLNISNGTFHCDICESRLHRKEFCPNVWRAFHMTTTSDGPLMVPYTDSNRRLHCSNCAGIGHLFHECQDTFHITPYALCAESPAVPDYSRIAELYARVNNESHLNIALQLQQHQYEALASDAGCQFLQALSNKENVILRMEENSLTIEGKQQTYYPVCYAVQEFIATKLKAQYYK